MKRSAVRKSAIGCLSGLLATGLACANEGAQPKPLWINAPITVDAEGGAVVGHIVGTKGALAEAVHAELSRAAYLPASSDGKPVASQMHVSARVVLTPQGEGKYSITLDGISLAPLLRKAMPPRYPVGMVARDESGYVTLELTIRADGRVIRTEAVDATHPALSKEVLTVARGWRFAPSSVAGSEFEYVVTQPVWFQASAQDAPPEYVCRLDERRPRWLKQVKGGCLELMTITFRSMGVSTKRLD